MSEALTAPFPWFGGKRRAAHLIWEALGNVVNYVEPFAGSLAVLLARPHAPTIETVNDLDEHIVNFWRAITAAPELVADAADWPVMEVDLHARHKYLTALRGKLAERLMGDPAFYNATIAGWWVWGLCTWIGGGWCSDTGRRVPYLVGTGSDRGRGVNSGRMRLPHLGAGTGGEDDHACAHYGRGIHGKGLRRQIPMLAGNSATSQGVLGKGIHGKEWHPTRKVPAVAGRGGGAGGTGAKRGRGIVHPKQVSRIAEVFAELSTRLRYTRVTCGDFERILTPAVTYRHGLTGVVLDAPYDPSLRSKGIYAEDDSPEDHRAVGCSQRAREWALANGDNPLMRIALCGYEGEHNMPDSWRKAEWKAKGGYGSQRRDGSNDNAGKERIWFSPHCLKAAQGDLFAGFGGAR